MITDEEIRQALVKRAVESYGSVKLVPVLTAFVDWLMFPETKLDMILIGKPLNFYQGMRIIYEARVELHKRYGFDYQKCDIFY